jgi:hypothetical protein
MVRYKVTLTAIEREQLQTIMSKGKLAGQHKVPRLSNERKYLEEMLAYLGGE